MGEVEQTLVCVKKVRQEVAEQWEENMPLPGDIIQGIAKADSVDDNSFILTKARSMLNSELAKFNREQQEVDETIWLKIKRGDRSLKVRACIVQQRAQGYFCSYLQKNFTVRAASDERHVAVLADLSFQKCIQLQEMSRKIVNVDSGGFNRQGIEYDWKTKIGTYLPDYHSTIISSILFMPMPKEHSIEAITVRTMAWFTAAVSSGAPLVFVNIQTHQIISSSSWKSKSSGKEIRWGRQQKYNNNNNAVQGVRLWYLPGVAELPLRLTPQGEETRFGMDISRTDEGLVCVYSVTKGTAAERCGVGNLLEQANRSGHLVVISRLEGKSLLPSTVSSDGLINCCDSFEIKETLSSAMERMESIKIHIMCWPNQQFSQGIDASTLRPPLPPPPL